LASRDSNEPLSLASSCLYIMLRDNRDNCAFIYTLRSIKMCRFYFLQ